MDGLAKSIVIGGTAGILGILASGCRTEDSFALAYRRFRLSPAHPADKDLDVKLLRVEGDGTVLFQRGSETGHAKPGQPEGNPVAEWSDPASQTAGMGIFGCWRRREQYLGPWRVSSSWD